MSVAPCLSQSTISPDGKWEGWCWYPDRPDDRAVVEVFVGNRSIRAMRAARLRTEIRDLGMGDGYCGFQLPLPSKDSLSGYDIVEVRERRFGRVIGRLVFGEDGTQLAHEVRLKSAAESLHTAHAQLDEVSTRLRTRAAPFEELGAMLSRMSRQASRSVPAHLGVFAACEDRLDAVPTTDLGCATLPHVTLVIRTSDAGVSTDVLTLARSVRDTFQAMRSISTEIILLDDGDEPLAGLLPMRLRHLRLVRSMPANPPGVGLNAATLTARGTWLAFAQQATIGTAQLMEAVSEAATGTMYLEGPASEPHGTPQHHHLQALVMRSALYEMGGFDPRLDEPDLWADIADKARVVDQRILRWTFERDIAVSPTAIASKHNA